MNSFKKHIEKLSVLNPKDWEIVSKYLEKRVFSKKNKLLSIGQIEKYISFIDTGVVRLLIPNEDENKEITIGFSFQNEFISAYDSFVSQTKSYYEVEALTNVSVWSISYKNLKEIYKSTHIGNIIGRKSFERLLLIKSKREASFLNENAEQRYLNLFSERPELFKTIPLKYIASYIGITPQALSRIRRRIS